VVLVKVVGGGWGVMMMRRRMMMCAAVWALCVPLGARWLKGFNSTTYLHSGADWAALEEKSRPNGCSIE
jgi:hypothetical protein